MDDTQYMDEVLPCGHKVPLFEAVGGGWIAIGNPSQSIGFGERLKATVWCIEVERPSCGWVNVDDETYERIKAFKLLP